MTRPDRCQFRPKILNGWTSLEGSKGTSGDEGTCAGSKGWRRGPLLILAVLHTKLAERRRIAGWQDGSNVVVREDAVRAVVVVVGGVKGEVARVADVVKARDEDVEEVCVNIVWLLNERKKERNVKRRG